jgi:4-hydroxy-tetrahydrodipicolinate reductase
MSQPRVNLAFAGALGRMGRALLAVAKADKRADVAGGWERVGNPSIGRDLGEAAGVGLLGVKLSGSPFEAVKNADAVIDFSTPSATMETLKTCAPRKLALVIGTTGMDEAQKRAVAAYAKKAPCVMSSNFSIGVNILWKVAAEVARATGDDYDMEIVDVHHHFKKDAPSGTAETTADVLAAARGKKLKDIAVYGRHSREALRKRGELGIHALRAGDVVGDHTVFFAGPYERLELTHRAHARENFAIGAVKAALWLKAQKKKKGLYTMAQVLGL